MVWVLAYLPDALKWFAELIRRLRGGCTMRSDRLWRWKTPAAGATRSLAQRPGFGHTVWVTTV